MGSSEPRSSALFALTGLALALACVNVACLATVRSAGPRREMAIRLAIGARRSRLERQLLTEGLVLAVARRDLPRSADYAPSTARVLVVGPIPRRLANRPDSVTPRVLVFCRAHARC